MRYKFRGKRLDNGKWIEGCFAEFVHPIDGDTKPGIQVTRCVPSSIDRFMPVYETELVQVLTESVGQWTGLVDKNGVEIFEGDVVKAENTQNVGEIKYVHEHGSFLVYSHDENGAYYEYLDIGLCEKYFEVIGNVFDNGDLYDC